jgi:hypothetical protein
MFVLVVVLGFGGSACDGPHRATVQRQQGWVAGLAENGGGPPGVKAQRLDGTIVVAVRHGANGVIVQTRTNAAGRYLLRLPAGAYTVSVPAWSGGTDNFTKDVVVGAGARVTLNFIAAAF